MKEAMRKGIRPGENEAGTKGERGREEKGQCKY